MMLVARHFLVLLLIFFMCGFANAESKKHTTTDSVQHASFWKYASSYHITQSIALEVSKKEAISKYATTFNQYWKLLGWVRVKDFISEESKQTDAAQKVKYDYGGGIQSPIFAAGHIYEHGLYTFFGDFTRYAAWNDAAFQYTRWSIRAAPVDEASYGMRIAIPYTFAQSLQNQSWNSLLSVGTFTRPSEKYGSSSHFSASAGYKLFFWEPRMLYRYSYRKLLPLAHSNWGLWDLAEPASLKLSQYIVSQNFYLFNKPILHLLAIASYSDTSSIHYAVRGQVKYVFKSIKLSAQASWAEQDAMYDEWKYYKYIWNTSGQIFWQYYMYGNIVFRGEIAEYNIRNRHIRFPQSLKKYYVIKWKHKFDLFVAHKKKDYVFSLKPEAEYGYSYSEVNENYRIYHAFATAYMQWGLDVSNRINLYILEESRKITKTDMLAGMRLTYNISRFFTRVYYRYAWDIDWNIDYKNEDMLDAIYDKSNSFVHTLGLVYKKRGLHTQVLFKFESKENPDMQGQKKYIHDLIVTLRIRYNW